MRVSSIGADWDNQFGVQEKFLADLISAIQPANRAKLIGTSA